MSLLMSALVSALVGPLGLSLAVERLHPRTLTTMRHMTANMVETSLRSTPVDPPSELSLDYMVRLKRCSRQRAWPEALDIIGEIESAGINADSFHYTAAMTVATKAGMWREVLDLLDRLIISGAQPDLGCFNAALAACAAAGRPAEAEKVLERMPQCGVPQTAAACTAVGKACSAAGDWEGALTWFDAIQQRELDSSYPDYKKAIQAATKGGDLRRVVELTTAARALHPREEELEWLWRLHLSAQLRLLRDGLDRTLPEADGEATSRLQRALSSAAHYGTMPCFGSCGARSGYALAHLVPRTSKLADVLQLREPAWLRSAARAAIAHSTSDSGEALSLAGGPGFDLVALALVRRFGRLVPPAEGGDMGGELRVRVLDYEPGWEAQVSATQAALRSLLPQDLLACSFGSCDITKRLADPANAPLRASLPNARLLVASYCVAENARALRQAEFGLFEDLFREAAPGTLLVVLETTHRQFPSIVAAARRGADAATLEFDCPWVSSNNGFSLCLLKQAPDELQPPSSTAVGGAGGDALQRALRADARLEAQEALLARFDRDDEVHAASRGTRVTPLEQNASRLAE
jgi:pentatricopeptide repeat protein